MVPPVKIRSESSQVYCWNSILTFLAFCPWRETFSSKKTPPIPLLANRVQSQVSGKAFCINCDWHFIMDRLLKLRRGWENAICKCQITRKIFKFFMLLSQPLISAFQFQSGERNSVNVQGWILRFKKLDCLYSSSDSSASESRGTIAAFVPQGRGLLHRLQWFEEAGEATFRADEGHRSACLRKSVKCNAIYLFIYLILIVLSVSVHLK